jgi:hypothetical protein
MNRYEIRLSDYTRFKTIEIHAATSAEAKKIAQTKFPNWGIVEVDQIG